MEHFGITTVEAMAAGCVPVVINLGGQKEIVDQEESGFLWNTIEECLDFTKDVIDDKKLMEKLSKNAIKKSKQFEKPIFCQNIEKIVYG